MSQTSPGSALPSFDTKEDAVEWMEATVNDPFVDNIRFAFDDDQAAQVEYGQSQTNGCCGEFDAEIIVGGRPASIGCNYGH